MSTPIDRRDFAFEKLNLDKLPEPLRGSIGYYRGTTISYEFTLQMTEVNNNGAALTILRSFSKRTNNIGLGASDNLIARTPEISEYTILLIIWRRKLRTPIVGGGM